MLSCFVFLSPLSHCSEEEESDEDAEQSSVCLLSLKRLCVPIGRLGCQSLFGLWLFGLLLAAQIGRGDL